MQNMILLFFALFFTAGLYLISAELLNVPTYKATKAILGMGKREPEKGTGLGRLYHGTGGKAFQGSAHG